MEEKDIQQSLNQDELKALSRNDDYLPAYAWISGAIWRVVKGVVLWIVCFILDIFKALWNACIVVYKLFTKGLIAVWKALKSIGHKFRFNDWAGRLNFVVFGTSSFTHKRYLNGALYLIFEIVYVVCFFVFGTGCIYDLGSLGEVDASYDDPVLGRVPPDNSLLIMIYAVLWLLSIFLFFFIWRKSIDSGYKNYRIDHFDDFNRRSEVSKPYSDLIDSDIAKNNLYNYSTKELKERYADVYAKLSEKAKTDEKTGLPDQTDLKYFNYVLDSTISYRRDFHLKLQKLEAKKSKLEAKIDRIVNDATTNDKIAALKEANDSTYTTFVEARESLSKVSDEIAAMPAESRNTRAEELKTAKKLFSKAQFKKIVASNKYVAAKQKKQDKIDKLEEKLRLVDTSIEDMLKNNLSFSTIDSVDNQSKYGKFNVYYKVLAKTDTDLIFYRNYKDLVDAYEQGLATYQSANEDNLRARDELTQQTKAKIEEVNKQFDGIENRRASILGEGDNEKRILKETIASVNADGSLSDDEKKAKIAEAKAVCAYNLKTVKGKVLSLPSKKEVKKSRKEDLSNVVRAYKRDFKGLKTDYTAEEYALYCAANKMIVDHGVEFKFAYSMVKKYVAEKRLSEQEVAAKVEELSKYRGDYVASKPTKFDGAPRTVKEQISSLLDENFHMALLFLPILGVLFFTIMPLALSILVAFTNYDTDHNLMAQGFNWVGLENWARLFRGSGSTLMDLLSGTIIWTFVWAICATFSCYFLGIIFALMINKEGIKFKKVFRFCFMLSIAVPSFVTLMAVALLLKNDIGAVANLYFDITGSKLNFAASTGSSDSDVLRTKVLIILINLWHGVPYTILQTSGILMNIPRDLYESSKIDGAGTVTQFTKITLPYIFFVTGPSLIQTFIGNINNFGVIYFLTGGGPAGKTAVANAPGQTDLLVTYIYKLVVTNSTREYGLASVIGIIVFVICAFVSIVMYNRSSAISREDQFQ